MSEINKLKDEDVCLDSLQFVRLRIPSLIPIELIEMVKGRTFTPEQFYNFQESQVDNPDNYLFALVDEDKKIRGYLYAFKEALDGSLFINTFSIEKKYWGKGKAIDKVTEFLRHLVVKLKCPNVFWCTTNEKFFMKKGFKRSKVSLMQYQI